MKHPKLDGSIAIASLAVAALQWPLWLGSAGWSEVDRLESTLEVLSSQVDESRLRNAALAAEIDDLREGLDAVDERARQELGLVGKDETFLFFIERGDARRESPTFAPIDNRAR